MKTIVGFCFTEQPLIHLTELGFVFQRSDQHYMQGYREFLCHLSDSAGTGLSLEIREIIDEDLYFNFQTKKNFDPFEFQNTKASVAVNEQCLIHSIQEIIDSNMQEGDLKNYFSIKKSHPIWALWLKCKNFELFQKNAQAEKKILWRGQPAILISMGESCFDFIVT